MLARHDDVDISFLGFGIPIIVSVAKDSLNEELVSHADIFLQKQNEFVPVNGDVMEIFIVFPCSQLPLPSRIGLEKKLSPHGTTFMDTDVWIRAKKPTKLNSIHDVHLEDKNAEKQSLLSKALTANVFGRSWLLDIPLQKPKRS